MGGGIGEAIGPSADWTAEDVNAVLDDGPSSAAGTDSMQTGQSNPSAFATTSPASKSIHFFKSTACPAGSADGNSLWPGISTASAAGSLLAHASQPGCPVGLSKEQSGQVQPSTG